MSPRPKNPPPDRRGEILEAAFRVFAEKGYRAATMAEIARAAGVTPAALYYYFPSKADLFRAAVTERRSQLQPALAALASPDARELPPREFLGALLRAMADFLADERTRAVIRILLAEGPRDPSLVAIFQEEVYGNIGAVLGYLEQQMAQGKVRPMDPRVFLLFFQGPLLAMVIFRDLLRLGPYRDLPNPALVEPLAETILAGLVPEKR
ncbi:MAG: TetR/AcrR family transcriptional regulator [Bacillota bacterium]